MRPYRDVATVAGAQIFCFLLLTHLEPNFFLIHLYQSILYIAILVMLFYMEDRWAYMIGMLASVVWLGLAYESGILGSGVRQLSELRTANLTANLVRYGRGDDGAACGPDDCLLRQALVEGIFGTRESAHHILREPGDRGCVLRNPAAVLLGNDPQRVTRQGLNEVAQSFDTAFVPNRNNQGAWILKSAARRVGGARCKRMSATSWRF